MTRRKGAAAMTGAFVITERSGGFRTWDARTAAKAVADAGFDVSWHVDEGVGNFLETRNERTIRGVATYPGVTVPFGSDGALVRILATSEDGASAVSAAIEAADEEGAASASSLKSVVGATEDVAVVVALSSADVVDLAADESLESGAATKLADAARRVARVVGKKKSFVEVRICPDAPAVARAGVEAAKASGVAPFATVVAETPGADEETLKKAAYANAARAKAAPADPKTLAPLALVSSEEATAAAVAAVGEKDAKRASKNAALVASRLAAWTDEDASKDGAAKAKLVETTRAVAGSLSDSDAAALVAEAERRKEGDAAALLATAKAAAAWTDEGGTFWIPKDGSTRLERALGISPFPKAEAPAFEAEAPERPGVVVAVAEGKEEAFAAAFGDRALERATRLVRLDFQGALKAAARIASMKRYGLPNEFGATASRLAKEAAAAGGEIVVPADGPERTIAKIAKALVGTSIAEEPSVSWTLKDASPRLRREPVSSDEGWTTVSRTSEEALAEAGAPVVRIEGSTEAFALDAYAEIVAAQEGTRPIDVARDLTKEESRVVAAPPARLAKDPVYAAVAKRVGEDAAKAARKIAKELGIDEGAAARAISTAAAARRAASDDPAAYVAAERSAAKDDAAQAAAAAAEAKALGVRFLRPDACASAAKATVEGRSVRLGLSCASGVDGEAIVAARDGRAFSSIADFLERTGIRGSAFKTLAQAGAFDAFAPSRKAILAIADRFVKKAERVRKTAAALAKAEEDLASATTEAERSKAFVARNRRTEELESARASLEATTLPGGRRDSQEELVAMETAALGHAASTSPLEAYASAAKGTTPIAVLALGERATTLAVVSRVTERQTKTGRDYATFRASDETGSVECVCWPRSWKDAKSLVVDGAVLKLVGSYENDGPFASLRVSRVKRPFAREKAFLFYAEDEAAAKEAEAAASQAPPGGARALVYSKEDGTIRKLDASVDPKADAIAKLGRTTRGRMVVR